MVNFDLCCGHGLCAAIAPDVFVLRDDDKAYVVSEEQSEDRREEVEQAVRACPQMAIDVFA
jgi:ferredoxin